ncbi:MAG TPA: GntR family transcriptional regulator [Bacilli bacterium]|nr:MAG: HTH-type transcriptional repressor YvoA [Tenericutes bacterium ADurb.BinA124]HNZ50833.1 GntR family transcriptional regulator [Bacilli bacterium]HPX83697.1 GntR family transcriptional regulator [Bacilli bacterium]HQC74644.1 GntR family transcriptional regulator [Bacilli bacterium]
MNNVPIYQKIEKDLRVAILDGRLKQGDLVPSETELASKYQVTRMTVRQAINNLLVDGYIYRHKGRGTFVTFNKKEVDREEKPFFSFTNEMKGIDAPITTTVLKFEKRTADEIIAMRLQLKIGAPIYYVERLRHAQNIPLAYERVYLPVNMYDNITPDKFIDSFYDYVQNELNWKIRNCVRAIEARGLTKNVADLLHQKEGEPSLYMSSVTYLDNGRAFVYTRCYFHAEHFRFKHNFSRAENNH